MDTSKTYIKMSDCPEIQGEWKPIEGDWVLEKTYKDVPRVLKDGFREGTFITEIQWEENDYLDQKLFIWLPRQDQLQEMLGDYEKQFEVLDNWREGGCDDVLYWNIGNLKSWEQLWLAFVMWELSHKKKWDGSKWCAVD